MAAPLRGFDLEVLRKLEMTDLPNDIGPHEGIEFDLMRAGQKHVALFFELEPDGLDGILADGYNLLKFRQFMHDDTPYFAWIVFRDGYGGDAELLKTILLDGTRGIVPAREHDIGRLLGYTTTQVDAFIKHAKSS